MIPSTTEEVATCISTFERMGFGRFSHLHRRRPFVSASTREHNMGKMTRVDRTLALCMRYSGLWVEAGASTPRAPWASHSIMITALRWLSRRYDYHGPCPKDRQPTSSHILSMLIQPNFPSRDNHRMENHIK